VLSGDLSVRVREPINRRSTTDKQTWADALCRN
jgi:hypothetical protein